MPHNGTGEGVSDMENRTGARSLNGQFVQSRRFIRVKEKPFRSKSYLDFLAHYDAELVQIDGLTTVARCKTGIELPLEQKGKRQMVTLLLDEFRTIAGANEAIGNYKASHS
jgi:hypothetical protein